jgi:hypothetical protein
VSVKVAVRMYRQGLGDCFLLSFEDGSSKSHVLIDCGVVLGAAGGSERTQEVVGQILEDCGGELDLVVATHEHWDHVSGFKTAREQFEQHFTIREIWMAWTENPKDRQANRLRKERSERVAKLALALERWKTHAAKAVRADVRDGVRLRNVIAGTESLLDFFGPGPLAAKGQMTRDALDYLKEHSAPKQYLEPGDEKRVPGTRKVRAYVLGPPRDEARIKKDLPTKSQPETYGEEGMRLSTTHAFLSAAAAGPGLGDGERYQPFDAFYRISASEAVQMPFFADNYGFGEGTPRDSPNAAAAWRRIEEDWLSMTSELALMLDSDTNNTSLVLAFELGLRGKVLLFAADAQVGNWLSWHDVEFDRDGVTTADLLARTVFYKVGHHASHNATLRDQGLELMTSRRLAAFIPVDQATAHKVGWKKMPFNPLLDRLRERCQHRVVRLDEGVDAEASGAFTRSIKEGPPFEADGAGPLFFELEIE